jgi:hypothetical protein
MTNHARIRRRSIRRARSSSIRLLRPEAPEGAPVERFLPDLTKTSEREVGAKMRLRSAWSNTFIGGLKLAKQGSVVLGEGRDFAAIHVASGSAGARPDGRGYALTTP